MKINNETNSEVSTKRSGFFHDRPNVGLHSNKIATMRAVIILNKPEDESEANEFNPQPFL